MKKFIKKSKFKNISYKNFSIQNILSVSFTTIAVSGAIIVGLAFYLRSIHSVEKMASENSIAMLEQANMNLDRYLRNIMKVSDTIYYKGIKKKDLENENITTEMDLLYEANKDSLVSICLFSEYGEVLAATPISQLKDSIEPRDNEWFTNAMEKKENFHFSTPHVQNLFIDLNYRYRWVVSLSRSVEITKNGKTSSGVLLVDMSFSGIEQIFKNINLGKSGYTYLIDGNGEIIYHPRQQLIYSDLIEENNIVAASYEDGSIIESYDGIKRLVTVKTVGYTGWKIVGVINVSDIRSDHNQISGFAIYIMIFAIFMVISINMFVSTRIANPIKELEECVKKFESGVIDLKVPISGSKEVEHLGKAINSMVKEMQVLMKNITKEHEAKRKSELNALQAQINPHFLYNTLDSIIWMIENENYDGAITMVTSLARLFRISLSKGKNIISVKDELEHAKNYLTIQNIRYKDRFEYYIEYEEETLELATIKLIIQPLIENAIYHGMEFMSGDGEILVKAYIKNSNLYIDVIDNGFGMTEEVAKNLLTNNSTSKGSGSGIGLKNVHERIQLYFGAEYGLEIYSEPDEGTTIRIHMPCININDCYVKEVDKI